MNKFYKIMALALAVVICLGMSVVAFAASDYSIIVENKNTRISIDGKTYNAYKLFDATYSEDGNAVAYSISTGSTFYTNDDIKEILDTYFNFTVDSTDSTKMNVVPKKTMSESDARALADALQSYLEKMTADGTAEASGEKAEIELSAPGYYIVTGDATGKDSKDKETIVSAVILTTAKPTATVNPKADAPTLDKVIVEGEKEVKGTDKQVGDTVSFKLTSVVPDTTGYETYYFTVSDTLSSGLTYTTGTLAVKIGTVDAAAGTDYDLTVDGQNITIAFKSNTIKNNGGKAVVITYDAVINEDAKGKTDGEVNTAYLEYSNNPYDDSSKDRTPDKEVHVYDFDIIIDKYETGNESKKLADAEFVLYKNVTEDDTSEGADEGATKEVKKYYKWDANEKKVTWVDSIDEATKPKTDSNGAASFEGLETGTYYLHETAAPAGYNALTDDVRVEITASYNDDGTVKSTSAKQSTVDTKNKQYEQEIKVGNAKGTELPSTGGIGTTILYVIGSILVLGAGVVLISKRRAG